MSALCDAVLRPMIPLNDTEVACGLLADGHTQHQGVLADYAYAGSKTVVAWLEDDRRTFHGAWPGSCLRNNPGAGTTGCILPSGHRGWCAS